MKDKPKAQFIRHTSCSTCGSSDANSLYSDGSTYCFSCQTYTPPENGDQERRAEETMDQTFTPVDITYPDLPKRGLNSDILKKYSMGVGRINNKIYLVSNYYDSQGDLIAQHFRSSDKKFFWKGNTEKLELFGAHTKSKDSKVLVITEGEIDALSVAQAIPPVYTCVSVPNGAQSSSKYIKQNLEWINKFSKVILWFDNDEPGRKAKNEVLELIEPGRSFVVVGAEAKDANECLLKEGPNKVKELIQQAQRYQPEDIKSFKDLNVKQLIETPKDLSYLTNYEGLNRFTNGFKRNELVVIGAGTGIGKSTFTRHLAYDILERYPEINIGYVALEETNEQTALGFIARDNNVSLGDLFLDRTIIPEEDFQRSYEKFKERIIMVDHFGYVSPQQVLNKVKNIVKTYDTPFIFLDHLTMLTYGLDQRVNERRAIDQLLNQLRQLVRTLNIGVIAVSHLNMKGELSHEEGGRVTLEHFRGSGSIKQLTDVAIGLERNMQSNTPEKRHQTKVRVLKGRLKGDTGVCSVLDGRSGVLKEVKSYMVDDFVEEDNQEVSSPDF